MEGRCLYLEHAQTLKRYRRALERRDEIENSPSAQLYCRYNELIESAEMRVERRRNDLNQIRELLKRSQSMYDRVYYYTFVEKQKPRYVAKIVGYSERQIARIIEKIKKKIEENS